MPLFLPTTNTALSINQVSLYPALTRSINAGTQNVNFSFNEQLVPYPDANLPNIRENQQVVRVQGDIVLSQESNGTNISDEHMSAPKVTATTRKRGRPRKEPNSGTLSSETTRGPKRGKPNSSEITISTVDSFSPSDPNLPEALQNLPRLYIFSSSCKDAIMHRPYVKNEIVRSYEIYQTIQTFQTMLQDPKIKNPSWNADCSVPQEVMRKTITKLQAEYESIMNLSDEFLTPWEQKLRLLVCYKIENGHCEVHTTTTELGKWVARQRKRNKTKYSRVCDQDIFTFDKGILDRLEFCWKMIDEHHPWEYYYEQLKDYAKEHDGSTKIPQLYPPNQRLANWVHNQRKRYERFISGEKPHKGQIYPYQINLLNQIGFVWKIRFGRPKKSDARYRNKRYPKGKKEDADSQNISCSYFPSPCEEIVSNSDLSIGVDAIGGFNRN